jgi:hypothetical protein
VSAAELWSRGQSGWPRSFPIAQFPNPPLLLAIAGWGLAEATSGTPHTIGRTVLTVGLLAWALGEMLAGVNWFRRLLGAGVLAWMLIGFVGGL